MDTRTNDRLQLGIAALLGLLAAGAATYLTRDKWGYPRLPIVAAMYVGLPSAALGAVLHLASSGGRRPTLRAVAVAATWPAAFVAGLLPLAPLAPLLEHHDVGKAETFCAYLAPEIERHRAEHGRYPDEVSWLLRKQPELPKLVRKGFQYHAAGGSYRFEVVAPGTPYGWHSYDSRSRRWRLVID